VGFLVGLNPAVQDIIAVASFAGDKVAHAPSLAIEIFYLSIVTVNLSLKIGYRITIAIKLMWTNSLTLAHTEVFDGCTFAAAFRKRNCLEFIS